MTDIFLKLKNIQKKYIDASKNIQVLNGVNLSLSKNNIVSLIGPSGSGKSTLLHILGLLENGFSMGGWRARSHVRGLA